MQIEYSNRFEEELFGIYAFIAEDSIDRADTFVNSLKKAIENIPYMPYKHRQSTKSNDPQVRDMIFMGYVVVHRINKAKNCVQIIGIFNANEWGI
jgi:toxin ParE1/3/4